MSNSIKTVSILILLLGLFGAFYLGDYMGFPDPKQLEDALKYPTIYKIKDVSRVFNHSVFIYAIISTALFSFLLYSIGHISERVEYISAFIKEKEKPAECDEVLLEDTI